MADPKKENHMKINLELQIDGNVVSRIKDYCDTRGLKISEVVESIIEKFLGND